MVQWLRLCASPAGDVGSILSWGTKILQATWCDQKKKRERQRERGEKKKKNSGKKTKYNMKHLLKLPPEDGVLPSGQIKISLGVGDTEALRRGGPGPGWPGSPTRTRKSGTGGPPRQVSGNGWRRSPLPVAGPEPGPPLQFPTPQDLPLQPLAVGADSGGAGVPPTLQDRRLPRGPGSPGRADAARGPRVPGTADA